MSEEFKIGDRVKAFGCEGVVTAIHPASVNSIEALFGDQWTRFFTPGGYLHRWCKEPSLVLIDEPKIGEGVKTKRVEIRDDGRQRHLNMDKSLITILLSETECREIFPVWVDAKVTLVLEIPLPERKVEISESEFDQIFRDCYHSNSGMTFQAYLKQKLFGSESK